MCIARHPAACLIDIEPYASPRTLLLPLTIRQRNFSKVIKKRTNVPSFNRGDSPFASWPKRIPLIRSSSGRGRGGVFKPRGRGGFRGGFRGRWGNRLRYLMPVLAQSFTSRFLFIFVLFRLVFVVINDAITHIYSFCSSSAHGPAGVDSEERLAVAAVAIECRIDECDILTIKFLGRACCH